MYPIALAPLNKNSQYQNENYLEIITGTFFPKMFRRGVVGKLEMEQFWVCMATCAQMMVVLSTSSAVHAGPEQFFVLTLGNCSTHWNNFSIF